MTHLLVDISGHGYGHLAQTAPVLNQIARTQAGLKLTIRSHLAPAVLQSRIEPAFDYLPSSLDFGLEMDDAASVNAEKSYARYADIHQNYDALISREAEALRTLSPDLLLSNIPYHSLAAAAQIGLKSVAMCSLNWAELFWDYCKGFPSASQIHGEMQTAYQSARCFIQPEPSIEMPGLDNRHRVEPIAQASQVRRGELLTQLEVSADTRVILVGVGGMQMTIPTEHWPRRDDTIWLLPETISSHRADMRSIAALNLPYLDIMASVDMIITKTGYGMIVEATTHQVPLLCLEREDQWSEQQGLFAWARQHGYLQALSSADFLSGQFESQLDHLLKLKWAKPPVSAHGDLQAAAIIVRYLNE